jgi:hypothetical protein
LAAGTINQRACSSEATGRDAADSGLLSPELAAGICRVKGVKQLGSRDPRRFRIVWDHLGWFPPQVNRLRSLEAADHAKQYAPTFVVYR